MNLCKIIRYDESIYAAEIKINTNSAIKAQNQVKGMLPEEWFYFLDFKALTWICFMRGY
jgi:hypothetical protein